MSIPEELLNYLNEALEHAQNNPDKLCGDIKLVILEVTKEEAKNTGSKDGNNFISDKETDQLIDYVDESIKKIRWKSWQGK